MTSAADNKMKRSSESTNLDFMRSAAVGLVIADHLLEMNGHIYNINFHPFDWYCGRLGVLLFFVHTSFVLMLSMQRSGLHSKELFLSFYIRRVFRIYPLSVISVLLVIAFGFSPVAWLNEPQNWTLGTIWSNLLLVQNLTYSKSVLAPLWSLPLELQMYVVLPVIFVLLKRFPTFFFVAGLWLLSILCAMIQPHVIGRLSVALFAPCFVAGVIAYVRSMRPVRLLLHWVLWPIFLLIVIALYIIVESIDPESHHPAWLGWLVCFLVGSCLVHFEEIPRGMVSRACLLISRYSYGIYLFHMFALWVGFVLCADMPVWVQWIAFTAAIAGVSVSGYHMIEKPLIRIGIRIASSNQKAPQLEARRMASFQQS
jgi:peptidoglycan/LPS O-acetylase OafA/YrhL